MLSDPSLSQVVYDILTPRRTPVFDWPPGIRWKAVTCTVMFNRMDSRGEACDKVAAAVNREGIPSDQIQRFILGGNVEVGAVPGSRCKLQIDIYGPYVPSVWRQM